MLDIDRQPFNSFTTSLSHEIYLQNLTEVFRQTAQFGGAPFIDTDFTHVVVSRSVVMYLRDKKLICKCKDLWKITDLGILWLYLHGILKGEQELELPLGKGEVILVDITEENYNG